MELKFYSEKQWAHLMMMEPFTCRWSLGTHLSTRVSPRATSRVRILARSVWPVLDRAAAKTWSSERQISTVV